MKNKSFIIGTIVVVIAAFAAAAYFMKPKPAVDTPPAWLNEVLIRPDSYVKGPATVKVTIVEFFDPQCPACKAMQPVLKKIEEEYAGRIRWVARYMPLHDASLYAISALEEARTVGKYDEALDILFDKQQEWGEQGHSKPDLIVGYFKPLGVDPKNLERGTVIEKHQAMIDRDKKDAETVLLQGTPTFFVNGRRVFELGYEPLKAAIDKALAE